jgi:signal transduction histidine kinase
MEEVFTNISHELLTPLTVISASVEKLKEEEPRFSKDYALINMNIDRMVHLLQEILETSKSLSGELKLRVAHGDVMQYISRTALCLKPLMDKRRIKFTIKCTPQSMLGWIDTDKLDKIIYNLLSNAAKYTREGGNVALQVVTNDRFDSITITVTDNGIGISAKKMKKLFQRFNDGDYRKMHTIGTGLGMALTHDLVSLHGGSIDCESEEDKGTTFTVTLPISKKAFASAQIDNSQEIDFNKPQNFILDFEEFAPEA